MTDIRIIVPTAVRQAGVGLSSPTLFDDYSGRQFNGEAGGLAVNNNPGVYDYIARFAPPRPIVPTPTGDPAKPGSSQVNPNKSDEFLVVDAAGWTASFNNATYNKIFIAKGTDLHSESTKTITVPGEEEELRWITIWDDVTPSNVQDIKPWNLSAGDRVQMHRINYSGADWHRVVGLSWGSVASDYSNAMARLQDGTSNCLFYRCHKEHTNNVQSVIITANSGNNHTFYECAHLDADVTTPNSAEYLIHAGTGHRIITCEGRDNATFLEVSSGWGEKDLVLEDCCIYKEQRYDIDGNKDSEGVYVSGEALVGFKNVSDAGTDIAFRAYGNRFWGTRQTSPGLSEVSTGYPLGSSDTGVAKAFIDMRWNVFQDNSRNAIRLSDAATFAGTKNHSIVRNIVGDFVDDQVSGSSINFVFFLNFDKTEFYLNTVTNAVGADGLFEFFRTDSGSDDLDMMGNFLQETTSIANTGKLLNEKIGYNCWVDATTTINVVYGNDITPTKASLNMGDFTYKRKKLTGEETSTITDIVPTSSTPTSFTDLVPKTGGVGNDQIGSRPGIGVDDVF